MRVSREQNARNRAALIEVAARLFKQRGFDGTGVAEISKEAGLTHGAFYGHFASKEVLAAEANRLAQAESLEAVLKGVGRSDDRLAAIIEFYLSVRNRDQGCPMAAYACEVSRQGYELARDFIGGFEDFVAIVQSALPPAIPPEEAKRKALSFSTAMIGAVTMARACRTIAPRRSKKILDAVKLDLLDSARRLTANGSDPEAAVAMKR